MKLTVSLLALALCACSPPGPHVPDKYDFEDIIRQHMRDPSSVKFGEETVYDQGGGAYTMCGTLNAKNGFGGYGGETRFIAGNDVLLESDVGDSSLFEAAWLQKCRDH